MFGACSASPKNGNRLQIRRRDGKKFNWFLGTPPIARPTKSDLKRGNSDRQWSGPMMLDMFSVRVAKAADRANILSLYPHGLNQAAGTDTLHWISQLINAPDPNPNRLWIAEMDDRLIGCVRSW
jgi:hypothetical protein